MTLIELLVSQAMVLMIVAGLFAVVTAVMKSFHTTDAATQAQIRLREASHVLLRDLQAIGGADGRAGELVHVVDNTTLPDELAVFKVNPGLCGGGLAVATHTGSNLAFASPCPVAAGSTSCSPAMLEGKQVVIVSEKASFTARLSSIQTGSACRATVNPSDVVNARSLTRLRAEFPTQPLGNISQALDFLLPGSVRVGSTFAWRVSNEKLQRSVDGAAYAPVLDGVFDLQIARAYDVDNSGTVESNEWLGKASGLTTEPDLPGANARTYFGAEVALVTFGKSADGITDAPPPTILNRSYGGFTQAERSRRYRYAKLFMAARNRAGGG